MQHEQRAGEEVRVEAFLLRRTTACVQGGQLMARSLSGGRVATERMRGREWRTLGMLTTVVLGERIPIVHRVRRYTEGKKGSAPDHSSRS